MTAPGNPAHSIAERLLNISRRTGEDYNFLLLRYGHERLLYRISKTDKFEAMVRLGLANSRMKDFYDLWTIFKTTSLDATKLSNALRATFVRRKTQIPPNMPSALTPIFYQNPQKQIQWQAFVRRSGLATPPGGLEAVIQDSANFLIPFLIGLREFSDRERDDSVL